MSNAHVLIVDDDPNYREVVKRFLEANGYRVITAHHGAEALWLCAAPGQQPDLILMDARMPVLNGHETVGLLRNCGRKDWMAAVCEDYLAVRANPKAKRGCPSLGSPAVV